MSCIHRGYSEWGRKCTSKSSRRCPPWSTNLNCVHACKRACECVRISCFKDASHTKKLMVWAEVALLQLIIDCFSGKFYFICEFRTFSFPSNNSFGSLIFLLVSFCSLPVISKHFCPTACASSDLTLCNHVAFAWFQCIIHNFQALWDWALTLRHLC